MENNRSLRLTIAYVTAGLAVLASMGIYPDPFTTLEAQKTHILVLLVSAVLWYLSIYTNLNDGYPWGLFFLGLTVTAIAGIYWPVGGWLMGLLMFGGAVAAGYAIGEMHHKYPKT